MSLEPKPLTKEKREELTAWADELDEPGSLTMAADVKAMLADAAYWREAVRSSDSIIGGVDGYPDRCVFCSWDGDSSDKHSDCPWLKAQE